MFPNLLQRSKYVSYVDWAAQATFWRRNAGQTALTTRVASGPLDVVVSQAIALHPVDRESYFLTIGGSDEAIGWSRIADLADREDYPFNI